MLFGLKALLIILLTVPTGILVLCVAPFDRDGRFIHRFARLWSWLVLKIGGIRLRIQGVGLLDPARAYVFMANHQSNVDTPVLVQSLAGFQLRWMAKKELLKIPIFGWAVWASRHILVDRSDRARAMLSLRRARALIQKGISVVFFPEGTRATSDQLLPFKRGSFVLAVKTRTPIVPVTIKGSRTVLPKGDWRVRSGEIQVIISEPIALDESRPGTLSSLVNRVRDVMESNARHEEASDRAAARREARPLTGEALHQR